MPKFLGTVVIPKSTSSPAAVAGGQYYNTSTGKKYFSDGANWIKENSFNSIITKLGTLTSDVANFFRAYTKLGSTYWLCGQASIGIMSTSTIDIPISSYITASTSTNTLNGIAHNSGAVIVAVGNGGTILSSTNSGSTFAYRTSGTTSNLQRVTYGNGTFVAVGAAGVLLTSTNGTTWTSRTSGHGTTAIYSAAWIPYTSATSGYFMTGGTVGKVFYSAAGTTWTQITTNAATTGSVVDIVPYNYTGSSWVAYILNTTQPTLKSTNGTTLSTSEITFTPQDTNGTGREWYIAGDGTLRFVDQNNFSMIVVSSSLLGSVMFIKHPVSDIQDSAIKMNILDSDNCVVFFGVYMTTKEC